MNRNLMMSALALTTLALSTASAQMNDGKTAYVRVVHGVADAPAVDVFVDGTRTVANAPFKAVTPYGNVPAGKHNVMITAAGDKSAVVFQGDVTLTAGTYYTVAAVGYLKNLKPKIFTATSLNMNKGKAQVNVYHLSPDAPRVQALAVDYNSAPILPVGVAYGNEYTVNVDPMGVNLNIVPFGKTTPVVKNLTGLSVAGGKTYSIFALGTMSGKTLDFVVTEDKVVADSMMAK
ncbi:DUF4397 domain-containing protein [Deinococcus ruber]|uniref:DUF4397 domain-containing protein n=1 Tax=Deinococcus ruber TaxID=1848197 RepID=A0A918C8V9_9DEIO|nr:DUF4397 domain-containing protein [Deinococcus ruber]GGR12474.1 hypothetical protein GCM10008957_26740 [Deinococcus ruber]